METKLSRSAELGFVILWGLTGVFCEPELQLSRYAAGKAAGLSNLGSIEGGCSWPETKLSECAVTGDGGYQVF